MRDYKLLKPEEAEALEHFNNKYTSNSLDELKQRSVDIRALYQQFPAIRSYQSLFPNQYINPFLLRNNSKQYREYINDFKRLIENNETKERDILNFLKNDKLFIVASIVKKYADWGHHDLYVFPEFKLGTSHVADYLIIGKNSHGYHFMFVELERVYGRITDKNGNLGQAFNKGINQITDWEAWLDSNFNSLKTIFDKYRGEKDLPKEFFNYDRTRISFVVIAGRRINFKEKTYRIRRDKKNEIILLHYDNLVDLSNRVLNEGNF